MANGGRFAMWNALAVRTDYSASDVRELARRAKDAGPARRLLAIAAVMDGKTRRNSREWIARPCAIGSLSVSTSGDRTVSSTLDHCCYAWNTLIDQPWKIMSIAR